MSKYHLKEPEKNNTQNNTQNPYGNNNVYTSQNSYGSNGYNPQNPYGNGGYNQQNPYGNNGYNPQMNPQYYGQYMQRMDQRYAYQERSEEGVRDVVGKSFLFMMFALIITACASFITYSSPELFGRVFGTNLFYVLIIAELGIVFAASYALHKQLTVLSAVLFVAYSIINGITISSIFAIYYTESIVNVFIVSAALFGVMALIGLTTNMDLTKIGSLCFMGLIGIIIAGILNIFIFQSSQFDFMLSVIGIIIFIGLTAYDAQKIKLLARENPQVSGMILGMYGALELYLDFINIFLKLLRLLGREK